MHILQFYYAVDINHQIKKGTDNFTPARTYEGWNFNSGNYLFTTDSK